MKVIECDFSEPDYHCCPECGSAQGFIALNGVFTCAICLANSFPPFIFFEREGEEEACK